MGTEKKKNYLRKQPSKLDVRTARQGRSERTGQSAGGRRPNPGTGGEMPNEFPGNRVQLRARVRHQMHDPRLLLLHAGWERRPGVSGLMGNARRVCSAITIGIILRYLSPIP